MLARARLLAVVSLLLLPACGGATSDDPASSDASAADAGATDASGTDAKADAPSADAPSADAPAADAPSSDAPKPDGGGGFGACTGPGQCVLALKECCAPCGAPTLATYTPIQESSRDAHRKSVCPDPAAVPCPKCPTFIDKGLMSFCVAGACAPIDIRTHPFSACKSDADCTLRASECCECGGDVDQPIALARSSVAAYVNEVCKVGTACADCAPSYPADKKAVCDPTLKHCVVAGP
jgi:hypothetical protein